MGPSLLQLLAKVSREQGKDCSRTLSKSLPELNFHQISAFQRASHEQGSNWLSATLWSPQPMVTLGSSTRASGPASALCPSTALPCLRLWDVSWGRGTHLRASSPWAWGLWETGSSVACVLSSRSGSRIFTGRREHGSGHLHSGPSHLLAAGRSLHLRHEVGGAIPL